MGGYYECIIIFLSDLNNHTSEVIKELNEVTARWKAVGIALGLKPGSLDTFHGSEPHQNLTLMVTEWLKRNYNVTKFGEPTWQKLVEVVSSPTGGANKAHARDIAERHKAGGMSSGCSQ